MHHVLDVERNVYKALNLPRVSKTQMTKTVMDWGAVEAYLRAAKLGVKGNFRGDGRQSSGTFVIGPPPQGIIYEHRPGHFGELPDGQEILKVCSMPTIEFGVYNHNY